MKTVLEIHADLFFFPTQSAEVGAYFNIRRKFILKIPLFFELPFLDGAK